LTFII
jgi:signal transducing adaptor molecule